MGEARRRKLAAAAGTPWQQDRPRPARVLPSYEDPMCPQPPTRIPPWPERPPRVSTSPKVVVVDDGTSREDLEALRRAVEARHPGKVMVATRDDLDRAGLRDLALAREPARPPARRRRSPMEIMMIMAALGTSSGAAHLAETPHKKR